MKTCFKCQTIKAKSDFYAKGSFCRDCQKECAGKYYHQNKEKILEQHHTKKEVISAYNKERYLKIREKQIKYTIEYLKKHPEVRRKASKKWAKNNRDRVNIGSNNRRKRQRKQDVSFKLCESMRGAVYRSLKRNKAGQHWEALVGYTLTALQRHLKTTMPYGYTWNDYLCGNLHMDHKIPLSAFNFRSYNDIDFKKSWALTNLRLLPAKENLMKGATLLQPFQPSLSFSGGIKC